MFADSLNDRDYSLAAHVYSAAMARAYRDTGDMLNARASARVAREMLKAFRNIDRQ